MITWRRTVLRYHPWFPGLALLGLLWQINSWVVRSEMLGRFVDTALVAYVIFVFYAYLLYAFVRIVRRQRDS